MSDLADWLETALGSRPADLQLYERALTHASHTGANYERMEFLGDRVLGLIIADWLYQIYPTEPEGRMSQRLNALVARTTCAKVGRTLGLQSRIVLGKQALEDGAYDSDNVLGDVVEALIGALWLDQGFAAASGFVRRYWEDDVCGPVSAPRHPKSALQEWAASQNRKSPQYKILERSGPDHAPRFRVQVSLGSAGEAEAEGRSKQEAESAAAAALLAVLEA